MEEIVANLDLGEFWDRGKNHLLKETARNLAVYGGFLKPIKDGTPLYAQNAYHNRYFHLKVLAAVAAYHLLHVPNATVYFYTWSERYS